MQPYLAALLLLPTILKSTGTASMAPISPNISAAVVPLGSLGLFKTPNATEIALDLQESIDELSIPPH